MRGCSDPIEGTTEGRQKSIVWRERVCNQQFRDFLAEAQNFLVTGHDVRPQSRAREEKGQTPGHPRGKGAT